MTILLALFLMGSTSVFAQGQIPTIQPTLEVRFNGISKCKTETGIPDCLEVRNGIGILPVQIRVGADALNGSGQISIDDLKVATLKAVGSTLHDNGLLVSAEAEGPGFALRRFFTENNILQTENIQILQLKLLGSYRVNDSLEIRGEIYWSTSFNLKHPKDNLDFDVTSFENFKDTVCSTCTIDTAAGSRVWDVGANISVTLRDRISFIAFYQRYANYTYAGFTKSFTLVDNMWQNRIGGELDYTLHQHTNVYKLMLFARDEILINTRNFSAESTREGEEPLQLAKRTDSYNLVSFGIKAIIR